MNHLLIVSLSRSGGKLVRTLLDGHPQCNAFPYQHWNRTSKNTIPTRRIEAFARLSVEERLSTAGAAHVERKLKRLHPQTLVDGVIRAWSAEAATAPSLSAMYERLACAYFTALGRPGDALVVNHCGSLSRFRRDQLDAVYGTGRHLLTIRDPRAVFSSMQGLLYRKFTLKRVLKGKISAAVLERHIQNLETYDGVSGYLREFCENYRTMVAHYAVCPDVIRIRFEDLVKSPEPAMRRLATHAGIRWDTALLTPTELGVDHAPNSSFARSGSSIHARAADDWVGRLAPPTYRYIEKTLAQEMAALGYQCVGAPSLLLDEAPLLT